MTRWPGPLLLASLLLAVLFLALAPESAFPAGDAADSADVLRRAEDLVRRYDAAGERLRALTARAESLTSAGYGGQVLRKDLGDLAARVLELKAELARLARELDALGLPAGDAFMPGFALRATRETYDGPPLDGPLENGNILALAADVEFPDAGGPTTTYAIWQLFDGRGAPVDAYFQQRQLAGAGADVQPVRARFRLQGLANGRYVATLTHQAAADPTVRAQARFDFEIRQPVGEPRVWVTDHPGGEAHLETLTSDRLPHAYVAFAMAEDVESVGLALRVENAHSHALIHELDQPYARKPGQEVQRRGVRLPPGAVRSGDEVRVTAVLTPPEGAPRRAAATFRMADYALAVRAPETLEPGASADFSLVPPEGFAPPFRVTVRASGAVAAGHAADGLTGTLTAISATDGAGRLVAALVDATGRKATGQATVRVLGAESAADSVATDSDAGPAGASAQGGAPVSYHATLTFAGGSCTADAWAEPGAGRTVRVGFCGRVGYATAEEAARVKKCVKAQRSKVQRIDLDVRLGGGGAERLSDCPTAYSLSTAGDASDASSPAPRDGSAAGPDPQTVAAGSARLFGLSATLLRGICPPCAAAFCAPLQRAAAERLTRAARDQARSAEIGTLSAAQWDGWTGTVWRDVGRELVERASAMPYDECLAGTLRNWATAGRIAGADAEAAERAMRAVSARAEAAAKPVAQQEKQGGTYAVYGTTKTAGADTFTILFADREGLDAVTGARLTQLGLCEGYDSPKRYAASAVRGGFPSQRDAAVAMAGSVTKAKSVGLGCTFWLGCVSGKWVMLSQDIAAAVPNKVDRHAACP
jgi:hypothetical protein